MNTTGKANEDLRFDFAVLPAVENLPISHGFKQTNKQKKPQKKPARRRQPRHKKVGAAERCTATSDMFTWHTSKKQKENNKCNMKQKNDR